MLTDAHQHAWTASLVEALERRHRVPFVRRVGRLHTVHLAGELPSAIDLAGEAPAERLALLAQDGVERALIALPSTLGIEALPRQESLALIGAHLDGVEALGSAFDAWGPLPPDAIGPDDVDAVLVGGCAGVSLPAGAFATPRALAALRPVLRRIEALDAALFVHPGPGRGETMPEASLADPLWWPALTRQVAQMQQAWLALNVVACRAYPRLRVVFAMLAGGAPLLDERLQARGGPSQLRPDHLSFYDTSSYGPGAIEAMAVRVGEDQLVYGSDSVAPLPCEREWRLRENAGRLLGERASVAA